MSAPKRKKFIFWNYKLHLWIGIITAVIVLVMSVTGVILNHKREWGFMIDPRPEATAATTQALPLAELVQLGIAAFDNPEYADESAINRMDFRPSRGAIKVRFRDPATTEVILNVITGDVISIAPRKDVWIEHLHSGELFGDAWVILSDIGAGGLILLTLSGIYIWVFPGLRKRARERAKQKEAAIAKT
jgi:hypothetical protein